MNYSSEYFKHISELDYPEYADEEESLEVFLKRKNASINLEAIDLSLLDLSLSDSEFVDNKLLTSLKESLQSIGRYAYSQDKKLINLISKAYGVDPDQILITSGCDGALRIISELFIDPGDSVTIPLPSFSRYEYHTKVNQGLPRFVLPSSFPFHFEGKNILDNCRKNNSKLMFLANPNNPTGIDEGSEFIKNIASSYKGILVLDESLLLEPKDSLSYLIKDYANLIITGSFSKVFGLAGMRVGFIIASPYFIKALKVLVSPFEISSLSLACANYVLEHNHIQKNSIEEINRSISYLSDLNSSYSVSPSISGTVLIESSGKESLYGSLLSKLVKTVEGSNFRGLEGSNCVRISLKNSDAIKKLILILNNL